MRKSVTVDVDVDIDIDDLDIDEILEDISTERLEEELQSRREYPSDFDETYTHRCELIEAIRSGDRTHLPIVLDRWMPGAGAML